LCFAESSTRFHSETNGYSVAIPRGWRQVPGEIVRQVFGIAFSESNLSFDVEMVLAVEFSESSLAYPYLVAQVKRYSKYGVNQPLKKNEIEDIFDSAIKTVNQAAHVDNLVNYLPEHMQEVVSAMHFGKVYLDRENMCFLQGTAIELPTVGKVKQVSLSSCGRQALVKMTFICPESDWDRFGYERSLILDSFHFDAGADYMGAASAVPTYKRTERNDVSFWKDMAVDIGVYGTIGGVLFAVAVVGSIVRKMKAKPRKGGTPSAQGEVTHTEGGN